MGPEDFQNRGMLMFITRMLVCAIAGAMTLGAGEVGAPTIAKFLRIISVGAPGGARVNCLDKEVAAELSGLGVRQDPTAMVVWAVSEKDVVRYAEGGRLIICGELALLNKGAALAILAEDGHPAVYINPAVVAAAKVRLPDALLKLAKVAK